MFIIEIIGQITSCLAPCHIQKLKFESVLLCSFIHMQYVSDCINHDMQFPKGDVPQWVRNAMEVAGIDISECCASAKCHVPSIQEQPLTVPDDANGVVQQN